MKHGSKVRKDKKQEKGADYMAQYVTCEYCKSNLDPGEKCDCQENMKQANQNIVIGNTVHTCSSKLNSRKEAFINA